MLSKNSIIYQIVTDRFNNESDNLFNEVVSGDYNAKFSGFLGGNFRGIINKIGYLKLLGITHVMISPVQLSDLYHGYLIKEF